MGRAIVRDPQEFLFDEPLSNLDAKLRVQMRTEIKKVHQTVRTTTVYVTHDQVEAMTLADRVVVMNHGVIEQVGPPQELYHHPATRFVAGFIGSPAMNFLPARVSDGAIHLPGGAVLPIPPARRDRYAGAAGRDLLFGIRPEHLVLAEDGIPASVTLVEPTGSETQVSMRLGDTPLIGAFRERVSARPGDTIRIMPDLSLVHLFGPDGNRIAN